VGGGRGLLGLKGVRGASEARPHPTLALSALSLAPEPLAVILLWNVN
jgi:hypothetical protein